MGIWMSESSYFDCLYAQDYIQHMDELVERVRTCGRTEPIPAISQKQLLRQAAEEARAVRAMER